MTQVRGINGGPIVNMNTINGITFKTITFDSNIVGMAYDMKQEEDGNFSVMVLRKSGNKTNTQVPISAVVTIEGVDYPIVVSVKFTVPTPLVASEDTKTVVRGNKDNPVTVTQFTYLPN